MSDEELKPCPCCNSEKLNSYSETIGHEMYGISEHGIRCMICGITAIAKSHEKCVESWNTRVHRTCESCKLSSYEVLITPNARYLCYKLNEYFPKGFYCKYHEVKNVR